MTREVHQNHQDPRAVGCRTNAKYTAVTKMRFTDANETALCQARGGDPCGAQVTTQVDDGYYSGRFNTYYDPRGFRVFRTPLSAETGPGRRA